MAATHHEARGNAREPDGGHAGTHRDSSIHPDCHVYNTGGLIPIDQTPSAQVNSAPNPNLNFLETDTDV
ncbi:MAG: hypothetical protein KGN32_12635 [Burkholderiales bacterium]|nr:hypothetical protein [Burkholderiales bacterium]